MFHGRGIVSVFLNLQDQDTARSQLRRCLRGTGSLQFCCLAEEKRGALGLEFTYRTGPLLKVGFVLLPNFSQGFPGLSGPEALA